MDYNLFIEILYIKIEKYLHSFVLLYNQKKNIANRVRQEDRIVHMSNC